MVRIALMCAAVAALGCPKRAPDPEVESNRDEPAAGERDEGASDEPPEPAARFDVDGYGPLVSVTSDGSWSRDDFAKRFGEQDVAGARRLDLGPCDEDCLDALLAAPVAGQLVELHIADCFNAVMAERLAAAEQMTALRGLALGGCTDMMEEEGMDRRQFLIGDADLARLLAAPHLAELRALELSRQGVCDRGIDAIVAAPAAQHLERLAIRHSFCIDDRGARALASGRLPKLRVLDLIEAEIATDGARALMADGALPSLETLILDRNDDVDDAVLQEIQQRFPKPTAPN